MTNPWAKKLKAKKGNEVLLRAKVAQTRRKLFAAGWTPVTLPHEHTPEQHAILLKLCAANEALTLHKIR